MKLLISSLFLLFTCSIMAQQIDITGKYYQSSGNPEGGTTFVVMPNNTFIVAYFGGIQKGTWEETNNSYTFTYHSEPKFVLYGRKNLKVKDSVLLNFAVEANQEYAIRFNSNKNEPFTPIFNKGANCFSYPYSYSQLNSFKNIEIHAPLKTNYYSQTKNESELHSFFIKENYNEYLLTGLPSDYTKGGSFKAVFDSNKLVMENGKSIKKNGEIKDIRKEDLEFFKSYIETEMLPEILTYGNEFFPYFDEDDPSNMIPFKRIEALKKISISNVIITDKSLFNVTCNE